MSSRLPLLLVALLVSCREATQEPSFPKPKRPVAAIVGDSFSTEDARDRMGEAEEVMRLAGIQPGMWVADIGAGEGYYTTRLSPVVGPKGRVLAEDIVPGTIDRLALRVQRERLDNVAVRLGTPDDPRLPASSFDRIFLIYMYHEIASPYALLWRIRPALKPGGEVIVVDSDRPTKRHGMPLAMLKCEFEAVGYQLIRTAPVSNGEAYLAAFRPSGARPEPEQIKPCKS